MKKAVLAVGMLCAGLHVLAQGAPVSGGADDAERKASPPAREANQAIQWNRTLLGILRTPGAQPSTLHPTRSYAMLHAAIFDAVNAIQRRHPPLLVKSVAASPRASVEAAAAAAGHGVLVALYPSFAAALDGQLAQALATIPDGPAKADGVHAGEEVARQVLELRRDDGSGAPPPPFVPRGLPGFYAPTPPNFPTPAFTHWSKVTPFLIERADAFRPGPPPSLNSERYTKDFDEVKSLGRQDSTSRSADQTVIGRFWGGAIQNYWNEIAQTAALAHHLDLGGTARLFAVLDLTMADAVIALYDAKYGYEVWRPVTAIRQADTDGNPETSPDPAWLPLPTNTAPDPSYPGAHSEISTAAARALASLLGDRLRLDVTSESLPGVTRSFPSFSAAAREAGLSRIYAGQHFRFDHEAGELLGRRVAGGALAALGAPSQR